MAKKIMNYDNFTTKDLIDKINSLEQQIESQKTDKSLQGLFDSLIDIYYQTDIDGNITRISPSVNSITGYKPEELIGHSITEYYEFPEDRTILIEKLEATGKAQNFEATLRKKNGGKVVLSSNVQFIYNKEGLPLYIEGISRDVTDRKESEERLQESEEKFSTMFHASPSPMILSSIGSGKVLDVNKSFVELTLFPREELIGNSVVDLNIWAEEEDRNKYIKKMKDEMRVRNYQIKLKTKNGNVITTLISGEFVTIDNEKYLFTSGTDITNLKRAENALTNINWLLTKSVTTESGDPFVQPYGNLLELNTSRTIVDSVGEAVLRDIVGDYLDLLDSSGAVYEKNGDYALGIFSSGWCRFLDNASYNLCNTKDKKEALNCGKWLCHESCWNEASFPSIETGEPVDIECSGGIRLYAIPIKSGGKIIGSINFGYGDPPEDDEKLNTIAKKYNVEVNELKTLSKSYESRPSFIIDIAKKRLQVSANLIGEITERRLTEEALKKSKQRLSLHIEHTPLGVIEWDKNFLVVEWNNSAEKIFGYSREEVIGKHPKSLILPEKVIPHVDEIWNFLITQDGGRRSTNENITKTGKKIICEWYNTPLINDNGDVIGAASLVEEITQRIEAETALLKSEEKFRRIANNAPDIIYRFRISPDPGFEYISPAVTEIAGYTPQEYYDDPELGSKIIHPDDRANLNGLFQGKVPEGPHLVRWIRRDGKIIWTEDRTTPIYNGEGELIAIEGIARDVSAQKAAEKALKESEVRFKGIYENATIGIYRTSPGGEILMANPALIKILGFESFEQMKLRGPVEHGYEDSTSRSKFIEILEAKGEIYNWEDKWKKSDGTIISVLENAHSVLDDNGSVIYYDGFVEDITEIKNAEAEIVKSKDLAENSERLKSEFLAQMSHEIRTPINAILSFSNLLRDELKELVPEEMESSFDFMDNAGRRIIRTIDLILNMSEMQTGTYKPTFKNFDIFEDILIPLSTQYKPICRGKGLNLIISNAESTYNMIGDEYTVTQIFDNLLGNAVKYTKEGKIEIIGKHEKNKILIDVIDTGVGISEEYLPDLFLPFSQEEQGYTRKFEGAGLGLALVKNYCDLNNAEIYCESKKGKGSKFSICFLASTSLQTT